MNPHILELTPFSAIGYPSRHTVPTVKHTADIPTFWNSQSLDTAGILSKLHSVFTHSKHFEVCLCYNVDAATGEFTYLLGRGIDHPADFAAMEGDMTRLDIPGGPYAIFSTPPANDYIQVVQDTWNEILTGWLPDSEFEYDDSRMDFEYYDHRDHGWYFGGKVQMDICVPIRQRTRAKSGRQKA